MYAAAAAAAVAIIIILKPGAEKIESNEQLYARYARPEELPAVVRGANDDSLLVKATVLYNQAKYAAALLLLDSITRQKPLEAQLQLAMGICFLETGIPDSAIRRFDSLAERESVYKYDAVEWKGLSYLKLNKTADCIAALKLIPQDASNYTKAKELMEKLLKK